MARIRVPIFGKPASYATIDTEGAAGAELGVNLTYQGRVLDPREVLNAFGPNTTTTVVGGATVISGGGSSIPKNITTDDVTEGGNLYFTSKRSRDAVGGILVDSGDIHFDYDAAIPRIQATLRPNGVAPGVYGDAAHIPQITIDAEGRVSSVRLIPIAGVVDFDLLLENGVDYLLTESGDRLQGRNFI